jgi:endoglucanase
MMHKKVLLLFITIFLIQCSSTREDYQLTEAIRLNQIGFYPDENKLAIIVGTDLKDFSLRSPDLKSTFFSGKLGVARKSSYSDRKTHVADFSEFKQNGKYVLVVPGLGYSYPFEIKPHIHDNVVKASLKAFYFQRFSTALDEKFAGKWARPFSHADNRVLIHPSASSPNRSAGTIIATPKGWIDAGDYNKYIVNSGITMGTLLSAYEDFSEYFNSLTVDIPESNNTVPDILDEVCWNLRWMLTMQDPADGGVYHKCTNAKFDPMVMPHEAKTERYVVQKGTAAALDFAAVMAQASRVFKNFEQSFPGLADSCLNASKFAWKWSIKNPNMIYDQNAINKSFDPDVVTGEYGDRNFSDEFIWAACELAITTSDESYLSHATLIPDKKMLVPSWAQVKLLGYYSLLRNNSGLPELQMSTDEIKNYLVGAADSLISLVPSTSFETVMGTSAKDFIWGSNSVAANQAILLLQVYKFTNSDKYLKNAMHNLDYILGRNATGYSFVTGFGSKTPMHIHHRPSESDGVKEPVPGLLAGGPNPGMQDKCSYPSSLPDEAYADDVCSYASNEIAINWNAPLVYLAAAIEALHEKKTSD